MSETMMEHALNYAAQGFAVFPLAPKDKYPIIAGGFKNASKDPKVIGKWWRENPNSNIGIATGEASGGIVVIDLDVDDNKGINGYDTLRDWEMTHGALPETANTITGRGGYHYFYRSSSPIKNRVGILPGIDIRGDGGYIVAPPSIHPNGRAYVWEQSIDEFGIADVNDMVMAFLASGDTGETNTEFTVPDSIPKGKRNDVLFKMGCSMQAKSFSDDSIRLTIENENQKRCDPPLSQREIDRILDSIKKFNKGNSLERVQSIPSGFPLPSHSFSTYEVNSMLRKKKLAKKDENGDPVFINECVTENVVTVLRNDKTLSGKIKYNELAHAPIYFGQLPWRKDGDTLGEWSDYDDSNLRSYLESKYRIKGKDIYEDGFRIVCESNRFNPIVSYLEALPKWDGVERIRTLLSDFLGVEQSEYSAAVMKFFMMGALSRAYHPGCKFDEILVIVGEQGTGKSTFLRKLAINDEWFDDNLNTVEGTEAVERLRGKWILELAELLAVKRQKAVESIKSFLSAQIDSYREPYARRTADRKRCCVFAGTTNDYHFLTDRTGNRRYLPVEVKPKNITKDIFQKDIGDYFNLVWAEAMHYFKEAGTWPDLELPKEIKEEAITRQQQFLEEDVWVGMIQEWLRTTIKSQICIMDLWKHALGEDGKPKRAESNRLHSIMRNEVDGWTMIGHQRTDEYGTQRCYKRDSVFVPVDDDIPF